MKDLSQVRIILTEIPDVLFASLGPILARGNLKLERVPQASRALERLIAEPYDAVVTSHPLITTTMREFLLGIRRPPSASSKARVLVAVADEQRGELAPYLVERGIDEVVSPDEDPLLVQHAVSNILGVAPRAAVRLVLRLQAACDPGEPEQQPLLCTSVDLSVSGALIESSQLLPLGREVALRLFAPGGGPIEIAAQVVRHADPRFDRTEGFAVRFLDLSGADRDRLAAFLETESA